MKKNVSALNHTDCRFFVISNFQNPKQPGRIDLEAAGRWFGVSPHTVKRWMRLEFPLMAQKLIEMSNRAIPNTKAWKGFGFDHDGKLITPYVGHKFTPDELLWVWFERDEKDAAKLDLKLANDRINALQDEDERQAIIEELQTCIQTLEKVQKSPLVSHRLGFSRSVKRESNKES